MGNVALFVNHYGEEEMFKIIVEKVGGYINDENHYLEWHHTDGKVPCKYYKRAAKLPFKNYSPIGELYTLLKEDPDSPDPEYDKVFTCVITVALNSTHDTHRVEFRAKIKDAVKRLNEIVGHIDTDTPYQEYDTELFVFE